MTEDFKRDLNKKVMRAFRKAVKAELLEHKRLAIPYMSQIKKEGLKKYLLHK